MSSAQVTLEQTLSIWWSFAWRAVLVSMLGGLVLAFIGGFIAAAAGSPELSGVLAAMLAWLGVIPASIWALKTALSKKHGGHSITLSQSA